VWCAFLLCVVRVFVVCGAHTSLMTECGAHVCCVWGACLFVYSCVRVCERERERNASVRERAMEWKLERETRECVRERDSACV